jgi:glyoxylase-like metal-dependent hydrolase (beta-lactamase superfamily II)
MTRFDYTAGLHRLADNVWAWLQPDGGWGLSNAGLIDGGGHSLLVDTQFDLAHTRRMLAAMAPVTAGSPIRHAVNTHGNGDHCYGNELLDPDVRIWAAPEATSHMQAESPQLLASLLDADLDPQLSAYLRRSFGAFEFTGINARLPDHPVTADTELLIGSRTVKLLRMAPAHTFGDVAVFDPESGVVFAGDLLFIEGTPIMWAGPARSWIAGLERLLALDADTFVPGHGPVTDAAGVRSVIDYLAHIHDQAAELRASGRTAEQAATELDLGRFAHWGNPERLVINVDSCYRDLDTEHPAPNVLDLFSRMARWPASSAPAP